MTVKKLVLGHLLTSNCYLLSSEKTAVVIDPGAWSEEVCNFLKDNADKERMILLTHAHFDHIGGAKRLREETETPIAIGRADADALAQPSLNLSQQFRAPLEPFFADRLLDDGEEFSVGDISFGVIHTPGHTPGGVCYQVGNDLFSGDTLFLESIGRSDFPGGDGAVLEESLIRLMQLNGDMRVFPGHGDATTVEHEQCCNPYIRFGGMQ